MTTTEDRAEQAVAPGPTSAVDLFRTITAHHESSAVHVAAKLGIADLIGDGAATHEELAGHTGANPDALLRLLRLLVSAGVLVEPEQTRFTLTAKGRHLRTDVPDSLHPFALMMASPHHQHRWGELEDCVRNGRSVMEKEKHANPFAQMPEHMLEILGRAMTFFVTYTADAVVSTYDFTQFGTLVEVGAGRGILLSAILAANPKLKGVLFELPYMVEHARARLADSDVLSRCDLVTGDFFESVPEGGDAYLLNNVLHDWSDQRSVEILVNCHAAMRPGAKLLIVETLYPAQFDSSIPSQIAARSDVNMLLNTGAKERSRVDFAALVKAAGFELQRILPIRPAWSGVASSSVVEAVRR
ncbi:O-methyltransferase [Actinokineospora spheciospongiae]|uniref:O-methyltransferase n=1 Tax=Actinokineospora spheciospongiae TaxID=909613 RepID=W7ISI2_9PSEU|nr:methyltransferase [Actinokineospora spheciospongiae]EWC63313.1 O-methyltransferase [Actinokineospora spheciospongiae]